MASSLLAFLGYNSLLQIGEAVNLELSLINGKEIVVSTGAEFWLIYQSARMS